MPVDYPDWIPNVTPNTSLNAKPTRKRTVENRPAIAVDGAQYRGCKPFTGVLELVDVNPRRVDGEDRYEVYCAWYGVKPRSSFPRISPGVFEIFPKYTGQVIDNISDETSAETPQHPSSDHGSVSSVLTLLEGAATKTIRTTYERSREARRLCLEYHGTNCCICNMSFGERYGNEAEGFIHVHHVSPISNSGGESIVNPETDLVPVCPNCHAMIHLGSEARSIAEVQAMMDADPAV